jgi:hypothetical protein
VKRFWRPPALPGARSCKAHGPRSVGFSLGEGEAPAELLLPPEAQARQEPRPPDKHQLCSGTFQYASLMNFDQLIIRSLVRA